MWTLQFRKKPVKMERTRIQNGRKLADARGQRFHQEERKTDIWNDKVRTTSERRGIKWKEIGTGKNRNGRKKKRRKEEMGEEER